MKLIDKQIKAVEETLSEDKRRYKKGRKFHKFDDEACPLCREFDGSFKCIRTKKCPMRLISTKCSNFIRENGFDDTTLSLYEIPLEETAGFFTSLLISLKEARK